MRYLRTRTHRDHVYAKIEREWAEIWQVGAYAFEIFRLQTLLLVVRTLLF